MAELTVYSSKLPDPSATSWVLDGDEAHHLVRVLRVRPQERVRIINGQGGRVEALFVKAQGAQAELIIESHHQADRPRCRITLAQAVLKGGSFEDSLRQAVEIGVSEIIPLYSKRTEVAFSPEKAIQRQARFLAIAIEACKQSGNLWLPTLVPFTRWDDYIGSLKSEESTIRLVASLESGSAPIAATLADYPDAVSATLLIGPEGDFTSEEYEQARLAGFLPVKLTTSVLRAPTAALYGLSVIDALLKKATQ